MNIILDKIFLWMEKYEYNDKTNSSVMCVTTVVVTGQSHE
jgi:hypothetical protein